jgi:uncharacterized protein DUF3175
MHWTSKPAFSRLGAPPRWLPPSSAVPFAARAEVPRVSGRDVHLNFYINRVGRGLSASPKRALERTKGELRNRKVQIE